MIMIALFVALVVVFDVLSKFVPFLQMPNGGSIDLSVMVMVVASYILGWKKGAVVALLGLLVTFMFSPPYILTISQFLFDYVFPVMVMGIVSIVDFKNKRNIEIAISLFFLLRILSLVTSGAMFWPPEGSVAGTIEAWIFSLGYNLPYSIATYIVAIIATPLLLNRLRKIKNIN